MKKLYLKFNKAERGPTSGSRGFTLIETLVALAIFSASIVALISVTASGVADTNYAKNKFIASYLAQEGVEMVRNIRDNAWISGGDWAQFVGAVAPCIESAGCKIEAKTLAVSPCFGSPCDLLLYDNAGFYTYAGENQSSFIRKITVEEIDTEEFKITSVVSWNQGTVPFSVSFSENLLNWNQ